MYQYRTGENVFWGTLILSASSIFVRMIGFLFRIYLSNTLGAEGIGLYTLIMSVYALCTTVATSGISTAVSKLVAEQLARGNRANGVRILRRAASLSLLLGVLVSAGLFFSAEFVARSLLGDPRTTLSLRLLAPGMPFLSVSACIRGYFIAVRRMGNPASAQVIEQLFKMAFIIPLLGIWLPKGLEYGCAVVVLGITAGEAVCLLYSLAGYLRYKRRSGAPGRGDITGVVRRVAGIAVPISLSSYVRSGLRLVEDILILNGLRTFSGADDTATGLYGMLKGMVMPLLVFPLQLLSSFVTTLTPEISRLGVQDNPRRLERTISMVLRYTCIISIFIVGMFMTFSYELGIVVYRDEAVGELLRTMSFLCPFMCIEMVVVSILHGLGEQVHAMGYSISDCVLRVVLVYFLVPERGAEGFLFMVVVSNLYTSLLNLRRLMKKTKLPFRLNDWILKPTLAALAAGQGVRVVCNYVLFGRLPLWLALAGGVGVMGVFYFAVLLSVGCLTGEDFGWVVHRLRSSTKPPKTEPELVV